MKRIIILFFLLYGISNFAKNTDSSKPEINNTSESKLTEAAPVNEINLYASLGSIIISLGLIFFSYKNTNKSIEASIINTQKSIEANNLNTTATLNSKRIEERKNEIYKKLNEFYGPFYQLRSKSQLLYLEFSESYKSVNKNFRTLTYLLDSEISSIPNNEKMLLKEIIDIGELCEKLIHDKAGLIDDEDLRKNWLPKASTHYLLIRLAYQGVIKNDSAKYSKYTFPTQIDSLIEKRIQALQTELANL